MSEQTSEMLRAWFKRVEPLYPELFNTAHAICGNYDLAEDALRSAILEVYLQNADGGMGFRERLRWTIRDEALRSAKADGGEAEFTWRGFSDAGGDPLMKAACRENVDTQRLLMLRYGVGFSTGRIGQVTGIPVRRVRDTLNRFEVRGRRSLDARERSRFEPLMTQAARRQLNARSGVPHPSGVYRAFEAEASQSQVAQHRVTRFLYRLLVVVMALVCAVLFWLFAVLVQPPTLEADPAAAEPTAAVRMETTYTTEAPA